MLNKVMTKENKPDDKATVTIVSHLLIRDKETKEILVNKRDTNQTLGNTNDPTKR